MKLVLEVIRFVGMLRCGLEAAEDTQARGLDVL